ncbi:GH3 family domain-containing protein [Maribacter hydrothermalis]|uniref:GH3 auxin-responsive promoter n=1 Tax=Maribacter hydrothermalis TaxID=1836467 RepID=A0A1B7Z1B6_9FLAO|nr:GH3 auxin-responsive promoter family protein [Maribacter hydrothermalis]APQ18158.1 GH3 auxin-responsive promoter [Maribacter hydrothermalis]OBR36505.1 GH3 auxin-responsive promoter [Maribacter hydrothermalis]
MAILGSVIKGFLELRDKLAPDTNPVEAQKKVFKNLLGTAKDTDFGRHYNFETILSSKQPLKLFKDSVPFFDYNKINEEWWAKLHDGETDVTWPGTPDYFALSSGTTGKTSKRIPVTNEMLDAIRDAGIKQVYALSNFDLPIDFFEKGILMLGSSTDLNTKDGHKEGEISGISASNIPTWFQGFYKPGEEIAQIDDWDERVQKIAEEAPNWDIGALSGIPSWMELMLQKVISYHNLNHIHEIWPNFQVYTSGGVAFGPYEKSFNSLLGKPVTVIDTYLASEGFIAFQARPETDAMQLVTDGGIYFEFVPFKPEYINQDGSIINNAPSLSLEEVETGQDYILIISTVSGAWRYLIGDTIEFTNVEKAEIKITGRTKFFLNTVGSQLSVNKLDDAVQHLEMTFDIKIPEYTLCAKRVDGEFYHCWYLGTENEKDNLTLANALDEHLKGANNNYKVARSKALKGVKVKTLLPSVFHEWNGMNKKKGGQVKMERVMGEDKFAEWEEFVQK